MNWKGCTPPAVVCGFLVMGAHAGAASVQPPALTEVTLNGLRIGITAGGGVARLDYQGRLPLLETTPEDAGLIEVAYPLDQFEPLRLASRYSAGVEISSTEDTLRLHCPRLGASRAFELPGEVSATVTLTEAADGQSIILSGEVDNRSERPVPQVIFPDLRGLLPVAGEAGTELRGCSLVVRPWETLRVGESDQFYAVDASSVEYTPGGSCTSNLVGRWLDLGGLRGGMSLFPRLWGWDPVSKYVLRLSQADNRLRLMCVHPGTVAPGKKWRSAAWVLTPHDGGWAQGIRPYREWVRQNVKREFPVPQHVREGLGFRTVWMCQNQESDPADAVWKFSDLPAVAQEAKEHGLDELVAWSTHRPFTLPLPGPYRHLGTEEELVQAAAACRRMGVNFAPFISVLQQDRSSAPRYGLAVAGTGGWTYHTELVPRFNPGYATNLACVQVPVTNTKWQDDVVESCRRLAELGMPSIVWDQYWPVPEEPGMTNLMRRIRTEALKHDPRATFAGEEVSNMEVSAADLDYTWNWRNYVEYQAFVSAFTSPRINININRSVEAVKLGFMGNLYLNVWPGKPDSINGSDWIGSYPELSKALKQCARLRRQFLRYFVEGTFVGDGVLRQRTDGVHVAAYVRPDSLLVIALNRGQQRQLSLDCDLPAWLPSGEYQVRTSLEGDGYAREAVKIAGSRLETPEPLGRTELALFEVGVR